MIKNLFTFGVYLLFLCSIKTSFAAIASKGYVDQQVDGRLTEINASTSGEGNVVTEISTSGANISVNKGINAETVDNKVNSIRSVDEATDVNYPSEKAVATVLDSKQDKYITSGSGTLVGNDTSGTHPASVAVGYGATANNYGTSLGSSAVTAVSAIAIGNSAEATAENAIQLGSGTNAEANTFNVGDYKLLGSDGKIPTERMPDGLLTNTATGSGSFSTADATPVTSAEAVAIGKNANAGSSAVSIGSGANASGGAGVALGYNSSVNNYDGVAIGRAANSGLSSIAIGAGASSSAEGAIQLGQGSNTQAKTFNVGFGASANYKLLGSDGKIPTERMPDGLLTNTATGAGSFSTGGAIPVTVEHGSAIGVNSSAKASGVAVGFDAYGHFGGTAIGAEAKSNSYDGIAIGRNAVSEGGYNVVIGTGAKGTTNNLLSIGYYSESTESGAIAIGNRAKATAKDAIQLGTGTNSEANTFSVGLADNNNYKLLGSDGKIPTERLPNVVIPVGGPNATTYAGIWIE